jgi:hypothetical protein
VNVRPRSILLALTAIAMLVLVGVFVGTHSLKHSLPRLLPHSEYCTAQSGSNLVTLDIDQMANAATIAAVGIRKGVPGRAVQVALATSLQESKLENLIGGDRDSVGLFQQRPSKGWGTRAQVSDPRYASSHFYGALLHVKGWQSMTLTQAAQAVQRSAYPDAYAQWTDESDTLAKALLGSATHAVDCYVGNTPVTRGAVALSALTADLKSDWGSLFDPAHEADPDTIALSVDDDRAGWQYAHWLVAHAQERGIMRVRFGNQQWTAKTGSWRSAGDPETAAPGETVVAEVFGSTA